MANYLCTGFVANTFNDILMCTTADGTIWSSAADIQQSSQFAPSLAFFENRLYVAFIANNSGNGVLVCSTADGTTWTDNTSINQASKFRPSLAVFNNRLYVAFISNDSNNGVLVCSTADGVSWTDNTSINQSSQFAPSLAVFNNRLYVAFIANNSGNGVLICSTADGATWTDNTFIQQSSQFAPSLAVAPFPIATVPEPPEGYSGSQKYILANGSSCATLTGVKATIVFTEDLVWESDAGFSIQLNAETNNTQTLDWLQFMVHQLGDNQGLWPWINIWSGGSNPQMSWGQTVANPVATMPQAARIPAGYSIVIALQNDSEGRVTGATWTVLDSSGNSVGSVSYSLSTTDGGGVPPSDLSQVASFQVTFGGESNRRHATFSSGQGVINLQADQPMNVDTSFPTCIGFNGGTAETSNIGYGALGAKPSTLFSQAFGVVPDSAQVRQAKPNARKLTAPMTIKT
jgi:hypothetical protein